MDGVKRSNSFTHYLGDDQPKTTIVSYWVSLTLASVDSGQHTRKGPQTPAVEGDEVESSLRNY